MAPFQILSLEQIQSLCYPQYGHNIHRTDILLLVRSSTVRIPVLDRAQPCVRASSIPLKEIHAQERHEDLIINILTFDVVIDK